MIHLPSAPGVSYLFVYLWRLRFGRNKSWNLSIISFLFTLNCSLLQGDVESIASKNPKELTALLEQISGSEEYKRTYEDLEEEKAKAEETSALAYQKKKTIKIEVKQKKEQKEEAEKHLRLQEQLVCLK